MQKMVGIVGLKGIAIEVLTKIKQQQVCVCVLLFSWNDKLKENALLC